MASGDGHSRRVFTGMTGIPPRIAIHTHPISLLENPERIRAAHRGELMHLILYFLKHVTSPSDIRRAVERAFALQGATTAEWDIENDFVTPLERALSLPEVQPWFAYRTTNLREVDLIDARGVLHRIDRLVVRNDAAEVIDFKVGHREDSHRVQLRLYHGLVAEALQRPVRGYLLYIDEPSAVEVP